MKAITKLKDQARLHEQREEWEQAVETYLHALRTGEEREGEVDLGIYNRIGDLYVRMGKNVEAVTYYEQAADRYADAGLYNNAIALCNKALRYVPGRVDLLRRLGEFSAAQGFFTDARRWYLDYAEQMMRSGAVKEAFQALQQFADLSDDPDVRTMLGRQLKAHGWTDEARVQFRAAYIARLRAGQTEEADALRGELAEVAPDTDFDALAAEAAAAVEAAGAAADAGADDAPGDAPAAERGQPAEDGEITLVSAAGSAGIAAGDDAAAAAPEASAAPVADPAGAEADEAEPLPMLDLNDEPEVEPLLEFEPKAVTGAEAEAEAEPEPEPPAWTAPAMAEAEPEAAAEDVAAAEEPAVGAAPVPPAYALPSIEPAAAEADAAAPLALDLDDAIERARDLVTAGNRAGAVALLERTHPALAVAGRLEEAVQVAREQLRLDPGDVRANQQWVEYAFRLGDDAGLVAAYLSLGGCLSRAGASAKAATVYQRVLDLDPGNAEAAAALGTTAPGRSGTAAQDDFVDLGGLLRDEEPEETTRFVVPEEEPSGDEERDFADMLAQFKEKLAEHVSADDHASHYDLGLAFKEMGLIEEAIAEFQTALRGGRASLKVYEELGHCFMLQEKPNVAVKILSRALELPRDDDADLLGVYYHLGRCYEELGRTNEARDAYERVIGIDITFGDVTERLAQL